MQRRFSREISKGYEALRKRRLGFPLLFRLWDNRRKRKRRCDKGKKRRTARKVELKEERESWKQ